MTGYLLRRIGQTIVVLLGVSVIVFALTHLLPGGPARAILGIRATPAAVAAFNRAHGYDQPIYLQYFSYLNALLHGDLGFSYTQNQSVASLLAQDIPKSGYLSLMALAISIIVGLPLGIAQAVRRNGFVDYAVTTGAFLGYSMPLFWLGLLLITWFAVDLSLLPPEAPQTATVGGALADPAGMVLPVAALAIVSIASFSRFMRSAAIENLAQDYIRTARAKGLAERTILVRHLLRNAMLPIITLIGLSIPALVAGNLIVEQVFNYPGVGLLFFNAALRRDYPVEIALTLLGSALVVVGNLLADLAYGIADPRVRLA
ncbi:MAG TPA: ABC transporter permease [Pseudonocardiaceae bacterium]|jgi:peptide/nickel transport system permease protein|nr:ABC transporter permease [Pseudonocardiaceae bacterium]